MMKCIFTGMKIDMEPKFYESKNGETCFFTISTPRPVSHGLFYKPTVQGFDEVPKRVKKMIELNGGTLKGCTVDLVLDLAPYESNGGIIVGYKIKEISFAEGFFPKADKSKQPQIATAPQTTQQEHQEEPEPEQTEHDKFMEMANMLNENPFG